MKAFFEKKNVGASSWVLGENIKKSAQKPVSTWGTS